MPSFAIEVEGEANPLTRDALLSTIGNSLSSHQNLKVSSQQLSNWEKTPGYFSLLQSLYSDFSLPQEVRFQAIIQLKNGIDKYWRKHTQNSIAKNEKVIIRESAMTAGVQEPVPALALQNALMLAKIVRYEYPTDWPDVFNIIISHLRTATVNLNDHRFASNILNITLQIIKELASGKLQRTKKGLEQIASELLQVLGSLYIATVSSWTAGIASGIFNLESARNSHSALKTLRRLLAHGFEHHHRQEEVKQLWVLLQEHQQLFWSLSGSEEIHTYATKHLMQLSKLFLDMARSHPAAFVLLGSMDILNRSWTIISENDARTVPTQFAWAVYRDGDDAEESPREKLALKALLLFRACVKMVFQPALTFRYQTSEDKADRKAATDAIKSQVLNHDFVIRMMEVVVTQYFIMRPSDLRDWEAEPDEWERREEEIADAWEFSIRSCSEKLFLDLVINFKELLVPKLLQVFNQYASVDNTNVLLKDSLYAAIGIAAACLDDVIDFNTFLRSTLVPEVQMKRPGYNLLRRRTSMVLAQWVPIKPEEIDRTAVYQIFTHLLAKEDDFNDHVVRVTAGRQLKMVLEPFEFKYDDFAPYATQIVSSIMLLTAETELSETKMALLETVRVAVTKLEGQIEPYAAGIMSMLPPLWAQSGEEHLMKQTILTMITAIVNSLREKSVTYHNDVLPLIHDSVQPGSEAAVYLLEEALELWQAILIQTPSQNPSPELLSMSSSLLQLLEMGSELLQQIFDIIESYTVLSPHTILAPDFLVALVTSLEALLPMLATSRARDAALAPHVLENLAATLSIPAYFDTATSQQAVQHLFSTIVSTGYLQQLLKILHVAYDYHQDPRPNRRPPDVIGPGETSLFSLLARMALLSPELFIQAINSCTEDSSALNWLVVEWIGHFDAIGDALRKKLQVLGLTSLLTATNPPPEIMLEQLQSLITVWTDMAVELGEEAAEDSQGDYLWSANQPAAIPEWSDATPEDGRKKVVSNNNPIFTINIRSFIAERLGKLMRDWPGGQAAFEQEWLSRVDSVVMKGFVDLGIL